MKASPKNQVSVDAPMNYITNTTKENGSGSADNTAVRRLYRLYSLAAAFFTALAFFMFAASASATEQRCNELGASCVCSEPFNTNQYVRSGSQVNPADSVTKQCTYEGNEGAVIARNAIDVAGTNESGIMSKLPQGHSVQYVLKAPEGFGGIYYVGHDMWKSGNQNSFLPRTSMRWYRYYSDNYQADGVGACEQGDKIVFNNFDNNPAASYNIVTRYGGHVYNFLNFLPPQDCCVSAIGRAISLDEVKGKWIRYELITLKRGSTGFDQMLYFKNVTDNLPEEMIFRLSDSSQLTIKPLTPPGIMNHISTTMYRQGSCEGNAAMSGLMIAGWETDAGQRIGPAYEIEGSSLPPTAPVANSQSVTTGENTAVVVTLTATDADGDALSYAVVSNPANGALSGTAPDLLYTPNLNFSGADSFTFKANDGQADSNIATVSITVGILFQDDFEDGALDLNWTYSKNISFWSEDGASLIGTNPDKKTTAVANPVFAGCTNCYVETVMSTGGGPFNKIWLLFHVQDPKTDLVELLGKEEADKWVLKHRIGKTVVAKQKFESTIDPNVFYMARIRYDGVNYIASIDGVDIITLVPGGPVAGGTVGLKVKKTVGTFQRIEVN